MFRYLLVAAVLNSGLAFIGTQYLPNMSILAFAFILYLCPLIINTILSVLAIGKEGVKTVYGYSFPLLSFLAYLVVAFSLEGSVAWQQFVQNSTVTRGEMYAEVSGSLLDLSQLLFAGLLYFVTAFIGLKVLEGRKNPHGYH